MVSMGLSFGAGTVYRWYCWDAQNQSLQLPFPRLLAGKVKPFTKYTSHEMVVNERVRTSHHLHIDGQDPMTCEDPSLSQDGVAVDKSLTNQSHRDSDSESSSPLAVEDDEEHLPAGQHVLVDIKNVNAAFLDSEERLATALIAAVEASKLTMLSYHCHGMVPSGVSCVGVLLESHVSFHTWPQEGVITLDLFTCGSEPLLPSIQVIERLFSVPRDDVAVSSGVYNNETDLMAVQEPPRMLWSHVLRGFRTPTKRKRILQHDLNDFVLRQLQMDYKKQVVSVASPHHQIDIFDIIDPRFGSTASTERSLLSDGSYESQNKDLFKPDRLLFLDGAIQSSLRGQEVYHEALVHPAMMAHTYKPVKNVAIIGGGEGAVLREVLKYSTVKRTVMIEKDEAFVNVAKDHLKEWNDCSDLIFDIEDLSKHVESCFDDPRVEVVFQDAQNWFTDRYKYECDCKGKTKKLAERNYCKCPPEEQRKKTETDSPDDERDSKTGTEKGDDPSRFDVIFMDTFDIKEGADLVEDMEFLESIYGALNSQGMLAMPLGPSPQSVDPSDRISSKRNRGRIITALEQLGFESLHVYEEAHCGLKAPWSFLVACKDPVCRFYWHSNESQFNMILQSALEPTRSGAPTLKHVDSAVLQSYAVPPKSWESVFCNEDPAPEECTQRGYDPSIVNVPASDFEVKVSSLGEGAGRGTFAKVDIPKGSYIMQEQAIAHVRFDQYTVDMMENMYEKTVNMTKAFDELSQLINYMSGYGFQQSLVADYEFYVDSGANTFVNHGCNATNNIVGERAANPRSEDDPYYSELTLDPEKSGVLNPVRVNSVFQPVVDRHLPHAMASFDVAFRDVKAGEEMKQNYLLFISSPEDWVTEVNDLKAQCRGEKFGSVKEFDSGATRTKVSKRSRRMNK